ncbi:MAG TPA: Sua5/YciO/YrdC/YwlC family protein [Candidatus Cryptobacteroides sp.]|nr:Sua5/YciO/YrdC/YwlC family protein [Candidatus Cryptobacteroides sp.]
MKIADIISEAFNVLKRGGIILYPTDTIWGIGCDACNEEAVRKVLALKKRNEAKSLILLASDLDMVARYIDIIPPIAIDLVEVNDAPMTIIYPGAVVADSKAGAAKRTSFGLAPSVVAEDGSVGIRIPIVASVEEKSFGRGKMRVASAEKGDFGRGKTAVSEYEVEGVSAGAVFCNKLIYKFRKPLVSTSANISGESAPSRFSEISKEIIEGVDYVVPESFIVEERGEAGTRKSEEFVKASRKIRFDDSATGKSSQIIKLGVNGEVKVIRF